MLRYSTADVDRRDAKVLVAGEVETKQRVHHRKGLDRLRRIKVVALRFVDEVQTGPDDGHTSHATWPDFASSLQGAQRQMHREVHSRDVSDESPRSSKILE